MLSLLTVTCFFDQDVRQLKGFGCLFPRDQGFRSRGVLFNDSIFEGRGPAHAETWIFGGALDGDIVNLSDDQIRETLLADRERFYGKTGARWPFTSRAGPTRCRITPSILNGSFATASATGKSCPRRQLPRSNRAGKDPGKGLRTS
jgi:hypothetical protein